MPHDDLRGYALRVAKDILFDIPFADFIDGRNQVFDDKNIEAKLKLLRETQLKDMVFESKTDGEEKGYLPTCKIKDQVQPILFP